jgi:hypothetical protein
MAARLTIAIPTYNRASLLRRALESALAQTSDQIEIYVSDNGSSDDTADVLAQYQDKRLRSIRRDTTVTRARHGTLIFSEVDTELILVLSDDDYIEPEFSREIIRLFDEHPDLSFAYTGCVEHYDEFELTALVGPRTEEPLNFIGALFAGKRQVSWCACVTRVSDLRRLGPQPEERIIGDMYFWTKIAFQGPVGCVALPISHYTVLMPSGDNESKTTPVLEWARDVKRLTEEVTISVRSASAAAQYQIELKQSMAKYLARSIANQFLWGRIFGMSRFRCLRLLMPALQIGGWHFDGLTRIAGALILSRRQIRRLVIWNVAKMSAQRE